MELVLQSLDVVGQSFLTVIVSELGDKTFISTAILAMKYSKSAVLTGNLLSMSLMMLIASYIGYTVMIFIDPHHVKLFSILVFGLFSILAFWEAYKGSKDQDEILSQVFKPKWHSVLWQTAVLIFFAEWGDKSQIGIIALSANNSIPLVLTGAIGAIICCGFTAILCGEFFNRYVSENLMEYISGLVFLSFALFNLKDYLIGSI